MIDNHFKVEEETRMRRFTWLVALIVGFLVVAIPATYGAENVYTGDSDAIMFPATMDGGSATITYGADTITFRASDHFGTYVPITDGVALPADDRMGFGDFVYTMDLDDTAQDDVESGWERSYQAGGTDVNGKFMGGSAIVHLVGHKGKLYAGNSYWCDSNNYWTSGFDPSKYYRPWAQVLRLDSPGGNWVEDFHLGPEHQRAAILESVTFATDHEGNALGEPANLLVVCDWNPQSTAVAIDCFIRNDTTGTWRKNVVRTDPRNPDLNAHSVRDIVVHRDKITGIDRIFLGVGQIGIVSGVYDPGSSNRIVWDTDTETGWAETRILNIIEADGDLVYSAGRQIYRRNDGPSPTYTLIEDVSDLFPAASNPTGGIRGMSLIPNPAGEGESIIFAMVTDQALGMIIRLDPDGNGGYNRVVERSLDDDISAYLDGNPVYFVFAAYSEFTPVVDPVTLETVHLIGFDSWIGGFRFPLWAADENGGFYKGAMYAIRDRNGDYRFREVNGRSSESKPPLVAVRTFEISPFAEDGGNAVYFGGHDPNYKDPSINTNMAWIFRSSLMHALHSVDTNLSVALAENVYTGDSDAVKFPATMDGGSATITYGTDTITFRASDHFGTYVPITDGVALPADDRMGFGDFVYTMDLDDTALDGVTGWYGQGISVGFPGDGTDTMSISWMENSGTWGVSIAENKCVSVNVIDSDTDVSVCGLQGAGAGNVSVRLSKVGSILTASYMPDGGVWTEVTSVDLATTAYSPASSWELNVWNYGLLTDVWIPSTHVVEEISVTFMGGTVGERPAITRIGDAAVVHAMSEGVYVDPGATADDEEDGVITLDIEVGGDTVDDTTPGIYTITYNVADSDGNSAIEVKRTVTVVDDVVPVITLTGEAEIEVGRNETYVDAGAAASDNLDGDITADIVVAGTVDTSVLATYTVTYTVSDAAGNAATAVTRTVYVVDDAGPVVTLIDDAEVLLAVGGTYVEMGATAKDGVDGTLANVAIGGATVNTRAAGTYVVTYTATDAVGNSTVATRTVTVSASLARYVVSVEYNYWPLNAARLDVGDITVSVAGQTKNLTAENGQVEFALADDGTTYVYEVADTRADPEYETIEVSSSAKAVTITLDLFGAEDPPVPGADPGPESSALCFVSTIASESTAGNSSRAFLPAGVIGGLALMIFMFIGGKMRRFFSLTAVFLGLLIVAAPSAHANGDIKEVIYNGSSPEGERFTPLAGRAQIIYGPLDPVMAFIPLDQEWAWNTDLFNDNGSIGVEPVEGYLADSEDTITFLSGGHDGAYNQAFTSVPLPEDSTRAKGDFEYTMDLATTDLDSMGSGDWIGWNLMGISVCLQPAVATNCFSIYQNSWLEGAHGGWTAFKSVESRVFDDPDLVQVPDLKGEGAGDMDIRITKTGSIMMASYKLTGGDWTELTSVNLDTHQYNRPAHTVDPGDDTPKPFGWQDVESAGDEVGLTPFNSSSRWAMNVFFQGMDGLRYYRVYNVVNEIRVKFTPLLEPTITLADDGNGGDEVDYIAVGSVYTDLGATAVGAPPGLLDITGDIVVSGTDAIDTSVAGRSFTVTYSATDPVLLTQAMVTRRVTVVEDAAPVLTLKSETMGDIDFEIMEGGVLLHRGYHPRIETLRGEWGLHKKGRGVNATHYTLGAPSCFFTSFVTFRSSLSLLIAFVTRTFRLVNPGKVFIGG